MLELEQVLCQVWEWILLIVAAFSFFLSFFFFSRIDLFVELLFF